MRLKCVCSQYHIVSHFSGLADLAECTPFDQWLNERDQGVCYVHVWKWIAVLYPDLFFQRYIKYHGFCGQRADCQDSFHYRRNQHQFCCMIIDQLEKMVSILTGPNQDVRFIEALAIAYCQSECKLKNSQFEWVPHQRRTNCCHGSHILALVVSHHYRMAHTLALVVSYHCCTAHTLPRFASMNDLANPPVCTFVASKSTILVPHLVAYFSLLTTTLLTRNDKLAPMSAMHDRTAVALHLLAIYSTVHAHEHSYRAHNCCSLLPSTAARHTAAHASSLHVCAV